MPYSKIAKTILGKLEERLDSFSDTSDSNNKISLESTLDNYFSSRTVKEIHEKTGVKNIGEFLNIEKETLLELFLFPKSELIEFLINLDKYGYRMNGFAKEEFPTLESYIKAATGATIDEILRVTQDYDIDVSELNFEEKQIKILNKINIHTVSDLLKRTREYLLSSNLTPSEINSIVNILNKHNLKLAHDSNYFCDSCGKHFVDEWTFEEQHFCPLCRFKAERVKKIDEISVELTTADSNIFIANALGVALHANITNHTTEVKKIKLLEFYLIIDNKQYATEFNHLGYKFNDETIMPMSTKCCGKIWKYSYTTGFFVISPNDYAIITLKMDEKTFMFKFVYTESKWEIDDYYCA